MSTENAIQRTRTKLPVQILLSMLTILVGVVLLAYMILVEDEPAAVPLLLIASGVGWLVVARAQMRPRRR